MGVFICHRCDGYSDSDGGSCIPALDEHGKETNELVHEECATQAELHAYLPVFYDAPEVSD